MPIGRSRSPCSASPAPTHARSIDSALTLDSLPSSIDPHGQLSPAERDVAVLRARASLADSERRRFKEERKWALSQGNGARASQLAWQVKRYTALMESFHREADAKVVEGASSCHPVTLCVCVLLMASWNSCTGGSSAATRRSEQLVEASIAFSTAQVQPH